MSLPTLTPASTLSAVVLPATGNVAAVNRHCPYKIYSEDGDATFTPPRRSPLFSYHFLSGAADQVSYVYKKLGGDILDIELTEGNVYSAYEESVLEYSYLVNIHQASNGLPYALGNATGSFNSKGVMMAGALSSSLGQNQHVALRLPKFDYANIRRTAEGIGAEVGLNSSIQYSASFDVEFGQSDYDLHEIIRNQTNNQDIWGEISDDKKILIKKVYYKTPHAMWRFFGYYGGLNVVGNLSTYGQFSDDSSFQLVPAWQNKMQAQAFEDAIYTRMSHFSYELKGNKIRLFPIPYTGGPRKMWVEFSVQEDSWGTGESKEHNGVNNMNTMPLGNLPYESINSIGKQWIRRFALALCKETLGQVRSKFGSVPIPGENVQLNGSALLSEAKDEQQKLRDELKTTLSELTYAKLAETAGAMVDNSEKVLQKIPNYIFVG